MLSGHEVCNFFHKKDRVSRKHLCKSKLPSFKNYVEQVANLLLRKKILVPLEKIKKPMGVLMLPIGFCRQEDNL